MATARKLPSGNWRVRCYSGKDLSGKKKYVSFTADTKKAAELMAAKYMAEENHERRTETDITVSEAINRYITAKTGVLSPATIRGYRVQERLYYKAICDIKVKSLTTESMQLYLSGLTAEEYSAKTISNAYGLLTAAVSMFRPDAVFRVTLPKKIPSRRKSPSDQDVQRLFQAADGELKICIALAAFGSMRRGEICALKHSDISGNVISVHADLVMDERSHYVYKEMPKTSDSVRTVVVPKEVIRLIPKGDPDEYIIKAIPNTITRWFTNLCKRQDLTGIRFHDLRHYYASIAAVLGIPDVYLSDFGGWKRGSGVMKEIYQNIIDSASKEYSDRMAEHFSNLVKV